jgi:hypothetical protein
MRLSSVLLAGVVALAGCKADFVVDDVAINNGFNVGNVAQGAAIFSEKNVNTEQGNPYGVFIADIKAELNDDTPTIELESATITVEAGGDAAHDALEEIFEGALTLSFVDETNNTDTAIATLNNPAGALDVALNVQGAAFDDEAFQQTLLSGAFKVKISGTAAATAANANVNLVTTLSFKAFK